MKTNSRFSRNTYAISDRIWWNKHLRHTTTEKYDHNGKGGYFRFDDDNNTSYYITPSHYHHYAHLPEGTEHIKCFSVYIYGHGENYICLQCLLFWYHSKKHVFYCKRPQGTWLSSVNPAERWCQNPAMALAQAGFSQYLECAIHRSESSPKGSFTLIPHPVSRWAITTT